MLNGISKVAAMKRSSSPSMSLKLQTYSKRQSDVSKCFRSNSGILAGVHKVLQHIFCCISEIHLARQACKDPALNQTRM